MSEPTPGPWANASVWIAGLVGFAVPVFTLMCFVSWQRRQDAERFKAPQDEKLLRPPGYSLSLREDKLMDDMLDHLMQSCLAGAFAGLFLRHVWLNTWQGPLLVAVMMFAISVIPVTGFAIHQWRKAWRKREELRRVRLGLRGEQAVAETLTEVAEFTYRAFHDLPGGKDWNIDHVVVGPRGIHVIETKTQRKLTNAERDQPNRVRHDDKTLYFPNGEDRNAIPQARRNAKWVAEFLEKKTGEPVATQPLVVIPGWYVERLEKSGDSLGVMTTKYLKKYLANQPMSWPNHSGDGSSLPWRSCAAM